MFDVNFNCERSDWKYCYRTLVAKYGKENVVGITDPSYDWFTVKTTDSFDDAGDDPASYMKDFSKRIDEIRDICEGLEIKDFKLMIRPLSELMVTGYSSKTDKIQLSEHLAFAIGEVNWTTRFVEGLVYEGLPPYRKSL